MNVEHEVELLKDELKRLSTETDGEGRPTVPFGVLFNDTRCANIFEALVGTLKAAKKKKVVTYEGELLLQGKLALTVSAPMIVPSVYTLLFVTRYKECKFICFRTCPFNLTSFKIMWKNVA